MQMKKLRSKKSILFLLIGILMLSTVACGNNGGSKPGDKAEDQVSVLDKEWETILEDAKGTTVNFYGWGGSQQYNDWVDGYLADSLKEKYDITLNRVGMDIDEILNKLLNEKQVNKEDGDIDVVWINGENFFTAKENDLLFGPITDKLPNFAKNVDGDSDDVKFDFGYPTEGYESPYGKAQFIFTYDSEKIDNPPRDHKELLEWAKENPGKFTYPALPDFTGSVFVRNIISDIVGYEQFMDMEADEEVVREAIQPAIDYLLELKPYLWKEGVTYPAESQLLDNMYADGEILMTMSYNPNSASGKIDTGEFKDTTRTFIFDKGTVGNTHFVAMPFNASNREAGLALINHILEVEVQASKYVPSNWGDLPVIDNNKISKEEKEVLDQVELGEATLAQDILLDHRIPEMPAKLVPIIEKIWMEAVPGESN